MFFRFFGEDMHSSVLYTERQFVAHILPRRKVGVSLDTRTVWPVTTALASPLAEFLGVRLLVVLWRGKATQSRCSEFC